MGMAASQARYLALVARKSNCEYEGQQINQSRLNLANQTADLFNQMLGLNVPVPPNTQDFTKTQYSFSDGVHNYVIDDWKQLPASETEYNYTVNAHYFTDVYTGSLKGMADPQVQISNSGADIATIAEIEAMMAELRVAETEMNAKYANYQNVKSAQEQIIDDLKFEAQHSPISRNRLGVISGDPAVVSGVGYRGYTFVGTADNGDPINSTVHIYTDNEGHIVDNIPDEAQTVLSELKNMVELGVMSLDNLNAKLMLHNPDAHYINDISEIEYNGEYTDSHKDILEAFGLATDNNTGYKYIVLADEADAIYSNLHNELSANENFYGYQITGDANDFKTTSMYLSDINDCNNTIEAAQIAYSHSRDLYNDVLNRYNALAQPTYVGNAALTYLDTLTEGQEIELKQVVKDMIAQGVNTDIINRFDQDGNYLGGVYSFKIYGTTYYTTYQNLLDAYASNSNSNNIIDAQYRMPYYNASYINTRIEQQGKALLETDGNNRFKTIRFENDSVAYSLNMETNIDEDAYNDAMNHYLYENAKYDKMVQDINAKTSIIHQEDQALELRLKQLDTEQNALSNEIDAVQKVVKDNVEASFKTFGG